MAGAESYFFSSTPLGPRLVYIRPVGTSTSRTGTIAAERSVVPAERLTAGGSLRLRAASADTVNLPTRLAVVTIRPATGAAPSPQDADTFQIASPVGGPLITASVSADDLRATRERWRRATWSLSLLTFALALVLLVGPLLDWRNRASRMPAYMQATLCAAVVVVAARVIARMASPADWSDIRVFSSAEYAGTLLGPLLTSPFDFLLTAGAAGALTGLLLFAVEAWRLVGWKHRRAVSSASSRVAYLGAQVVAGIAVAAVVSGHQELLRNTIANTTLDLLHFSLIEWNTPRLALQLGLVLAHATAIGLAVAILRVALARWSVPRRNWHLRAATVACWIAPLVIWRFIVERQLNEQLPLLASAVLITLLALYGTRLTARFRHGSQAFRLTLLTLALIAPAFAFYPTWFQLAWRAKSQLVENLYAPQAFNQRTEVQKLLDTSLNQIDALENLTERVTRPASSADDQAEAAFEVWRSTALADYPGHLVGRVVRRAGQAGQPLRVQPARRPTDGPASVD